MRRWCGNISQYSAGGVGCRGTYPSCSSLISSRIQVKLVAFCRQYEVVCDVLQAQGQCAYSTMQYGRGSWVPGCLTTLWLSYPCSAWDSEWCIWYKHCKAINCNMCAVQPCQYYCIHPPTIFLALGVYIGPYLSQILSDSLRAHVVL